MGGDFDPTAVPVRPAATVIPLRDGDEGLEVLVVRRDSQLVFHANSWVFPGGRIDEDEIRAANGDLAVAARMAAVREAEEEASLTISPDNLVEFSHWTTPVGPPRRFATWFFVVPAPSDPVVVDDGEIREFEWHRVTEAVDLCEAGKIQLAGPGYVSLLRLGPHATVAGAIAWVRGRANDVFAPILHRDGDQLYSIYQQDPAYETGDFSAPGPRHRNLIKSNGSYEYTNDLDPIARA